MVQSSGLNRALMMVLFLISSPVLLAQDSAPPVIEARVLNPTGYIKPGSSDEILVQVINPEGSGRIVSTISGSGTNGGYVDYNPYGWFVTGQDRPDVPERLVQSPEGCTSSPCIASGELPLHPGEHLTLRLRRLVVADDVPEGTEILLTDIYLGLEGPYGPGDQFQNLYTDKNVGRIVSHGTGHPSDFAGIEIESPAAGFPHATVDVELDYPSQLQAGEHFNLHATIRNQGDSRLRVLGPISTEPASGEHARSFNHLPCWIDCILAGSLGAEPGQQLVINVGNFFYEAEELRPGTLNLGRATFLLLDQYGRQIRLYADTPPIEIAITTPGNYIGYNTQITQIPQREPLEVMDLETAGDGLLIHDPNTHSDWVKLSATFGLSHEEVMGELGAGGRVEGFAIASSEQVKTLLLNHVHAAGINAQPYHLNDLQNRPVQDALGVVVAMLGGDPANTFETFQGVVSDLPLWPASDDHHAVLRVRPTGSSVFLSSADGVQLSTLPAYAPYFVDGMGTWLVRTTQASPERPSTYSSFYETTLHIPSVSVEGKQHAVSLVMVDPIARTLRLAALAPAEPDAEVVTFDSASGRMMIPRVALLMPDGTQSYHHVHLEYLPGSDPMLFRMIEVEAVSNH